VAHLLLVGHKPSAAELSAFKAEIASMRAIPASVRDAVARIAKESPNAHPMSILRSGVSLLSHLDPDCEDNSPAAGLRKAKRLLAQIPSIIGACQMTLDGKAPVAPDASLDHSANLLWMMSGQKPDELAAKILDVSLVLYAEHDFNASTFSCRTIASTETDMHSAVCGGIGALKGPLHGGANEEVMYMLNEIGSIDNVEPFIKGKLERKELIMGFGHRVYKAYDPRATYLKTFAKQIATDTGNLGLFDMSQKIEGIVLAAKADKGIFPNVDFYSATTYHCLGIKTDLFTCMFALSRMSGWTGHCIEQLKDNRLIRPQAMYTGPHAAAYTPIAQR
jgi:citrate synthase